MLLHEIEHHGSFPREEQQMNPYKVMEDPARGQVLHWLTFVVGNCRVMVLQGFANARLQRHIDQQTYHHHHHRLTSTSDHDRPPSAGASSGEQPGPRQMGLHARSLGPGCPLQVDRRELPKVLFAVEGTIGHHLGRAFGGVQRLNMCPDDLPNSRASRLLPLSGCISTGIPAWCSTINSSMTWFRSGR
jgi:hypothetical protein